MARKRRSGARSYSRSRVSRRSSLAPARRRSGARSARRGGNAATVRVVVESAAAPSPAVFGDPRIIPMTPGKARF